MTQTLSLDDPRLSWRGAISVEYADGYVQPWRLPHDRRALYAPPILQERAAMPAGVRLTFLSDTRSVSGEFMPYPEIGALDICCDGELVRTVVLDGKDSFEVADLPPGEKLIELWLPQFGEFRLRTLAIDDNASLSLAEDGRPRWITYGSSITQCRAAASPTQTWPAIVARNCDYNLTCLGYGGQCHLDAMIARMIRDELADYISLCVGINIYGAASLGERAFRPAIIGFVHMLRERHADTPLVVMSPIYSPPRETTPNAVGFTLQAMRSEVAEAVAIMQAHGDAHIHYVDGLEILSSAEAHLLPDELHPDADGYRLMGERFTEQVAALYFA